MIRLCELFAGVGAQRMALDRLGIEYESVGISEISRPALRAYKQIHGDLDDRGGLPYTPADGEPMSVEEVPPEYRIRRLTPRECWRLMDMYAPDGHEYYDDLVSDDPRDGVGISLGQRVALAGNSICVGVLAEVLRGVFAPSSPTLDRWTEAGA